MSDEESEKAAPVWASQRAKLNSRSNHVKLQGSGDTFHSFDPKEKERYAQRINKIMGSTAGYVPLNPAGNDLFAYLANGEALLRLLLVCQPGSVPLSAVEKAAKAKLKAGMSAFANSEALNTFLAACKATGLEVTSLGATDFVRAEAEHKEHIVLGLLWQLLKRQLANEIKEILLKQEAERELRGVKSADFDSLMARVLRDPEAYLLDWVNATLKSSGVAAKPVASISELSVTVSYTLVWLLHALAPTPATLAASTSPTPSVRSRAVLDWVGAQSIMCVTGAEDLEESNPRLLLPFLMSVFSWDAARVYATELNAVYVSRIQRSSGTSGAVGAYKKEKHALQYALIENLGILACDPSIPPLADLIASHATATFTATAVVQLRLGPIPTLVAKVDAAETAASVRARVEAWVRGAPAAAAANATEATSEGLSIEELRSFQAVLVALLHGTSQVVHVDTVQFIED